MFCFALSTPGKAALPGSAAGNFLIPALVDHADYRLGVAQAEIGDFGSAGAASSTTRAPARPAVRDFDRRRERAGPTRVGWLDTRGSGDLLYGDFGQVGHRSSPVEYRIEQHAAR